MHTDAQAAESARAVNALAYTVGRDVVFGAGQYAPRTHEGQRLLAHELTHVVQQQALTAPAEQTLAQSEIGAEQDTLYEREASNISNRVMTSGPVTVLHRAQGGTLQKAAPAVGIGALAAKCIIGAIVGVLVDLGIQGAIHAWKERTWRFWEITVDYCSVILSAILGCIGGVVAAKWLEPWLNSALGSRLGGVAGTLTGKILIFIAHKLTIGVPRGLVKTLLKLGCISKDQAKAIAPGVSHEAGGTIAEEPAAGTASEEKAVA